MVRLLPWLLLIGCKGPPGEAGVACWDANANGVQDPSEDANGDGSVDVRDCQGTNGADGPAGTNGADGPAGTDGDDGQHGTACWDLDGDGVADTSEDVNSDGQWDARDCLGAPGRACWDLDGDGATDASEDVNGDGAWTTADCTADVSSSLGGVVVDANSGALIGGAIVALDPSGDWMTTGPDGSFQFDGLAFGVYDVYASAPGLTLAGDVVVPTLDVSTQNLGVSVLSGRTRRLTLPLRRLDKEALNLTSVHDGASTGYTAANCQTCHGDRRSEASRDPAAPPFHALSTHSLLACTFCHSASVGVSVENETGWTFESAATLRKQVSVSVCTNCHACYPSDFCAPGACPGVCP